MLRTALLASAILTASPALALNIVVSNDDGLTSNVVALADALKAEGHNVIVSVPCQEQSGMGGAILFSKTLGPLEKECRVAAAKVGDPGAGPMTKQGFETGYYYVNGTPVMATLYGIDVAAQKAWGKNPDLIISGPNIGQNVGGIVVSSGTVSNVQYALSRGLPAIAFSADQNTYDNGQLDGKNERSVAVAQKAVELVRELESRSAGKPLLQPSMALNVNFPSQPTSAPWKHTRIGTYERAAPKFREDVSQDPMAKAHGITRPALPGIVFEPNAIAPSEAQKNDESVAIADSITVSVLQPAYDHSDGARAAFHEYTKGFIKP